MDTYYRKSQRDTMAQERETAVRQLSDPNYEDKAAIRKRIRRLDQNLERGTPPELTGDQRDKASARLNHLADSISRDMPSDQAMRRNARGTVGRHLAWHERHKREVSEYKNLKMALHPDSDDPDLCNIEQLRSHTRLGDPAMHDTQIGGRLFVGTDPSPAYQEGWDRTFGNGGGEEEGRGSDAETSAVPPPVEGLTPTEEEPPESIVEMQIESAAGDPVEAELTD